MFWLFGFNAPGTLAPDQGLNPHPPALEGKVLTTGLPGKSYSLFIFKDKYLFILLYTTSHSTQFCLPSLLRCFVAAAAV